MILSECGMCSLVVTTSHWLLARSVLLLVVDWNELLTFVSNDAALKKQQQKQQQFKYLGVAAVDFLKRFHVIVVCGGMARMS